MLRMAVEVASLGEGKRPHVIKASHKFVQRLGGITNKLILIGFKRSGWHSYQIN